MTAPRWNRLFVLPRRLLNAKESGKLVRDYYRRAAFNDVQ